MRSAAGGDMAGMPRVAADGAPRLAGGREDTALPRARMTWAPQPVLPRCPGSAAWALTWVRQTHQHRVPNGSARGGAGRWAIGQDPRPQAKQITGKGRRWAKRKRGGEERGAVNKELPLCGVLSRVQSARFRKAHALLVSPLGRLEDRDG